MLKAWALLLTASEAIDTIVNVLLFLLLILKVTDCVNSEPWCFSRFIKYSVRNVWVKSNLEVWKDWRYCRFI